MDIEQSFEQRRESERERECERVRREREYLLG